jgi:hypothetical protein
MTDTKEILITITIAVAVLLVMATGGLQHLLFG